MTSVERDLLSLAIGHRVRQLRMERGLSQGDLAAGIGSQSMISLIESGRQLPYPDVLRLLAQRLENPSLIEYADLLENGLLNWQQVTESNQQVVLDALRLHRGHWQDIHFQLALQLSHYFYMQQDSSIVREICELVIQHAPTDSEAYGEACFYRGSIALIEGDYPVAETWLRKSESLVDLLSETVQGRLLYNLAYLYTAIQVSGLAIWYAKRASEVFYEQHDFPRYGKSLGLLGTVQGRVGRLEDALETTQMSLDIVQKWEVSAVDRARIETNLVMFHVSLDQLDTAKTHLDQVKAFVEGVDDPITQSVIARADFLIQAESHPDDIPIGRLYEAIQHAEAAADKSLITYNYLLAVCFAPTVQERLQFAQKVYESTLHTNYHIEHALAAESIAHLLQHLGETEEAYEYNLAALRSYRMYFQKGSVFDRLLRYFPS